MRREDSLYHDPDLAAFYDLDKGWGPDLAFCARLARGARSVLDLGCGTGALGAALASSCVFVGVDPAAAMLAIARPRAPGAEWIEADARMLRLDRRFDLIVMTGHAFQTMLTDSDQRALLATVTAHLSPGGRFVFEARNPEREEWREWTPEASRRVLDHPEHGEVTAWNEVAHDPATGIVRYGTAYRIERTGRTLSAESLIRFSGREHIAGLLNQARLVAERWLGDWSGRPVRTRTPEIIPLERAALG